MNVTICKASYGSRPWFAVPEGADPSGACAVWLVGTGPTVLETSLGPVATDGAIRFCATKGALLVAVFKTGHTVVGPTQHVR